MIFRKHSVLFTSVCLLLGGCGYGDSRTAHRAQLSMVGMTVNDLQACAGVPDKTQKLNEHTNVLEYVWKPSATGSFSVSPLNLSTITFGGTGAQCLAMFRIVDDKVAEVHYAGDDDETIGTDGVCSTVVRGCIRQPETTMHAVKGGITGPVSAFSSPAVPQQAVNSVYNADNTPKPAAKP